ncbi:MAG: hypothetical protein M1820_001931 [Bogoriella megaspora]|nr:MAG: hypothetical protein M1820_001931 [Bogoriella megaspora]
MTEHCTEIEEEVEVINSIYGTDVAKIQFTDSIATKVLLNLPPTLIECILFLPVKYPFERPYTYASDRFNGSHADYPTLRKIESLIDTTWTEGQVCLFALIDELRDLQSETVVDSGLLEEIDSEQDSDEIGDAINSDSLQSMAYSLLGKTQKEICAELEASDRLHITHCESVMRHDLTLRFLEKRNAMRATYLTQSKSTLIQMARQSTHARPPMSYKEERRISKRELIDILSTPDMTFHGTPAASIRSIVRNGFILPGQSRPGTSEVLEVRCGSTWGKGIYTSPSALFSFVYSTAERRTIKPIEIPGRKLLVCATLMGWVANSSHFSHWRDRTEAPDGRDSCMGTPWEYIVYDSAQVLPCYVIHIHAEAPYLEDMILRATTTKPGGDVFRIKKQNLCPGDAKRLKQEQKAAVEKWFPYGYGPATGMRFTIEEVGEVDDDEEEYGDFQEERHDNMYESERGNFWQWDSSNFDYAEVGQRTEEHRVGGS